MQGKPRMKLNEIKWNTENAQSLMLFKILVYIASVELVLLKITLIRREFASHCCDFLPSVAQHCKQLPEIK